MTYELFPTIMTRTIERIVSDMIQENKCGCSYKYCLPTTSFLCTPKKKHCCSSRFRIVPGRRSKRIIPASISPINRRITVSLSSRLRSTHSRFRLVVASFGMLVQTVLARADLKIADVRIYTAFPVVTPGSFGGSGAAARSVEMITDWLAVVPGALVLG
jgi:hypothetical protein